MSLLAEILPEDRWNRSLMAAFLVLWAVSCIRLPHPEYFVIQHVPTVLATAALIMVERKQAVDRLGFTFIVLFLTLHLLGGRYLYSFVPYDDWSQKILGVSITELFGFQRNHYDRLVHVCFGLLFAYPLAWFFHKRLGLAGWWPMILAVCVILAAGAVYEIAEWLAAMTFAPDWAEAYNGQQGDIWDAQRDMACAAVGAFIAAGWIGLKQRVMTPRTPSPSGRGPG
jgi:putative membrane protein